MPMDRSLYPDDWDEIALAVKDGADWKCEECGKQCRRPGEPFDTHRRTLTVSHQNHDPADCRRENLKALCAPCHLRYDAEHHAKTRRRKRMETELRRLLEETLGELVRCFHAETEDDSEWLDSIVERAEKLGIAV